LCFFPYNIIQEGGKGGGGIADKKGIYPWNVSFFPVSLNSAFPEWRKKPLWKKKKKRRGRDTAFLS